MPQTAENCTSLELDARSSHTVHGTGYICGTSIQSAVKKLKSNIRCVILELKKYESH